MSAPDQPNWASPAWDTIEDILRDRGIEIDEFEIMMGHQAGLAVALKSGNRRIDRSLAKALSDHLGASPAFWLQRDADFFASSQRANASDFDTPWSWYDELPVKDMIRAGWLDKKANKSEMLKEVLSFFGLSDFSEWNQRYSCALNSVAFRKSASFAENSLSTLAWLRQGERLATSISVQSWQREAFEVALSKVRPLMRRSSPEAFLPQLRSLCADAGVALVVAKAPEGCRASGAARVLDGNRAIIQLSFRYLSDDHFWFTFFHEAGHLVLHGENHLFLENSSGIMAAEEAEANQYSAGMLIPESMNDELAALKHRKEDIIRFAFKAGTSPGIVVGQMQHRGILPHNRMNFLKRRYNWAEIAKDPIYATSKSG